MKLLKFCLMSALMSGSLLSGMEEGGKSLHCLNKIASADTNLIGLSNPLEGDHNQQRLTVKNFFAQLPEVVIADGEGRYEVDVNAFRGLLKSTQAALPQPKVIRRGGTKTSGMTCTRTVVTRTTSVEALTQADAKQPVMPDLKESVTRLSNAVSGKGKWAKLVAVGGTIFFTGMIVGWFYTTKAHYAAPHSGAGN